MANNVSTFYMDESGTRHPDHKPSVAAHGRDWFSLGGIVINDEDKDQAADAIEKFRIHWPQIGAAPLHSHEIRNGHKNFTWLRDNPADSAQFMDELGKMLLALPVLGIACVIDRPGYNARYESKYIGNRWQLCKTAFAIAVERAVKHSIRGFKFEVQF